MAAEPPTDEQGEDESLFGYERVPTAAKTTRVKRVFDAVSPRYDLMSRPFLELSIMLRMFRPRR